MNLKRESIFIYHQITQIRQEGILVIFQKIKKALQLFPLLLSIPLVIIVRFIRPLVIIRFGQLTTGLESAALLHSTKSVRLCILPRIEYQATFS